MSTDNPIITYGDAFAIADELDQIRDVFGHECLTFVKRYLLSSHNPQWVDAISIAMEQWTHEHPMIVADLDLDRV